MFQEAQLKFTSLPVTHLLTSRQYQTEINHQILHNHASTQIDGNVKLQASKLNKHASSQSSLEDLNCMLHDS